MEKPVYIHYGVRTFDPLKGFPIKNVGYWNKPKGGLWASRKNASFGWKDWCKREDFRECDEENSFQFVFKDDRTVIKIFTLTDLYSLPRREKEMEKRRISGYLIDFEECYHRGIDAIELCYYGREFNENPSYSLREKNLYSELYGWDCDSVVVLNQKSIIPFHKEITL